jgi:riboflavin biosynthesis pyrimidine reductase
VKPLELLWEPDGQPAFALPQALAELYPGSLGFSGQTLYANFVQTIDGVVALPSLPQSNKLIADEDEADRFVMGLLRACADAVLVGSGTMQASRSSTWSADRAFPAAADAFADLRRRLGKTDRPEVAFLTASGRIDVEHPALEQGAVVLTTPGGAMTLAGRLPQASEAIVVNEGDLVDLRAAVQLLRARGHEQILSEGGPTVFGLLLEAGLVDELFLTVSPLLAGRSALSERLGLIEGVHFLPDTRIAGELAGVRRHGGHLFLRYQLSKTDSTRLSCR